MFLTIDPRWDFGNGKSGRSTLGLFMVFYISMHIMAAVQREAIHNLNQMRLSQPMPPSLFPTTPCQGPNVVRGLSTYPVAVVADL